MNTVVEFKADAANIYKITASCCLGWEDSTVNKRGKHEILCSIPRTHIKMLGMVAGDQTPRTMEGKEKGPWIFLASGG